MAMELRPGGGTPAPCPMYCPQIPSMSWKLVKSTSIPCDFSPCSSPLPAAASTLAQFSKM